MFLHFNIVFKCQNIFRFIFCFLINLINFLIFVCIRIIHKTSQIYKKLTTDGIDFQRNTITILSEIFENTNGKWKYQLSPANFQNSIGTILGILTSIVAESVTHDTGSSNKLKIPHHQDEAVDSICSIKSRSDCLMFTILCNQPVNTSISIYRTDLLHKVND